MTPSPKLFPVIAVVVYAAAYSADSPAQSTVPRFNGLGTHSRPVSAVKDAQAYFDQGLAFLFAYNHDEAVRSFEASAALDPACAMAHWGIAMGHGSHINRTAIPPDRERAALAAAKTARKLSGRATPADRALIEALSARFADPPHDRRVELNRAYAKAMQTVADRFPEDGDIGALYAESLMTLRPWDLYDPAGTPRAETPRIVAALKGVLAKHQNHPLALHLMIHAVEASTDPGQADEAAGRLRFLQPGLGHMVHMPSHIDIRRGRWRAAVEANERAIGADAAYRKMATAQDYYHLYMAHNHHMLAFAAMMKGESKKALAATRAMAAGVPHDWVAKPENAAIADGYLAASLEVLVRFGRWDDVLAEPEPPPAFPIARALRHQARGVALAATGKVKEAREAQAAFRAAAAATPSGATFSNNTAADLYAVAELVLEGEILAAEGKLAAAIDSLRAAAAKEDKLTYAEPPDWVIPVRHPLAAFLLKAGRPAEAEAEYRDDLRRWPDNGWSLFGLSQSLDVQGKKSDAVRSQFKAVWQDADVTLRASCYCAAGVKP